MVKYVRASSSGKKILNQVYRDIEKAKNKLIAQAERKGSTWENFGQKEYRELRDKYSDYYYYSDEVDVDERNQIIDAINRFSDWAGNYSIYDRY